MEIIGRRLVGVAQHQLLLLLIIIILATTSSACLHRIGPGVPDVGVANVNQTEVVEAVVHGDVVAVDHPLSLRNRPVVSPPDEVLEEDGRLARLPAGQVGVREDDGAAAARQVHLEASLKRRGMRRDVEDQKDSKY